MLWDSFLFSLREQFLNWLLGRRTFSELFQNFFKTFLELFDQFFDQFSESKARVYFRAAATWTERTIRTTMQELRLASESDWRNVGDEGRSTGRSVPFDRAIKKRSERNREGADRTSVSGDREQNGG